MCHKTKPDETWSSKTSVFLWRNPWENVLYELVQWQPIWEKENLIVDFERDGLVQFICTQDKTHEWHPHLDQTYKIGKNIYLRYWQQW